MEGLVLLGMLGIGYIFVDEKSKEKENVYSGSLKKSGNDNSVYDVNNFNNLRNIEKDLVNDAHRLAVDGTNTIIDDKLNRNNRNTILGNIGNIDNQNDTIISTLSGEVVSKDKFMRDDRDIKIEPFYSQEVPDINFDENIHLTNHQGGSGAFKRKKKEIGQFFPLEKNLANVYGTKFEGPNTDQERFIPGNYKTSELPFQQEKISHIDSKSGINGDIGNVYANRNNVDNTRTISNPKLSYRGKILGGKHQNDKRGEEGEVYKHLPNQDYLQEADRWLVTTGAVLAKSNRPTEIIKDTNRQYFNDGKLGPAAPVSFVQSENKPMFKKSTNQQLETDNERNMTLENKANDDDHNKNSYFAYPNERDKTTERTHTTNLKSTYEGKTMGLLDNVKPTIKETTNFNYTGGARHETLAPSAIDQYDRADLNPNKEIISRGRYPTPESTKLATGADMENLNIKKIETDYFNHHLSNRDKLYASTPTDNQNKYTKDKDILDNVELSNRLDPVLLNPFKTNPYTQSLSSYGYT